MDKLKTTTDLVKRILETEPATRNNDKLLYYHVCKICNNAALTMPFGLVVLDADELNLPERKSVERCRRKLQEHFPDLRANATVEAFRAAEEDKYRAYGKGVPV